MVDHTKEWNYNESFLWGNNYPQCNGLIQSPIDISTEEAKDCRTLCNIRPRYKPSKCFVNFKNNTISIKYDDGSFMEHEGVLYELEEITIHTPSLHSIDGQKFDLEICLAHKLTDNSSDTAGVLVCALFEAGPHYGTAENFISQIIYSIPSEEIDFNKEVKVSADWSASWVLPKSSGHFSYNGSLPYPPCTQIYKTFVYEKIGKIGMTNIETFKRYLGNSSRPIRAKGSRNIFYTPFMKTANSEKKIFRSTNKYLKCYRENVSRRTVDTTVTSSASEGSTEAGLSGEFKKTINGICMSLIVLLIFVNAFYFVKYLFRHFYVQKGLRFLAGKEKINHDVIKTWKNCQGNTLKPKDKAAMKEAAEKATKAINSTAIQSGMASKGMSPTSFSGTRDIASRSTRGMQGMGGYGAGGMGGYGAGGMGGYGAGGMGGMGGMGMGGYGAGGMGGMGGMGMGGRRY